MMTSERILSHGLDGRVRDVMELCLLNAVLGGGALNGRQFSYANKQATYGDEVATRADWFEGELALSIQGADRQCAVVHQTCREPSAC